MCPLIGTAVLKGVEELYTIGKVNSESPKTCFVLFGFFRVKVQLGGNNQPHGLYRWCTKHNLAKQKCSG